MVRTADAPASGRRRVNRGTEETRDRLIEAALIEFAANGFDGASTRAIASRAGAHQPQINYHFESKDELWRLCLERLLGELDAVIAEHVAGIDPTDEPAVFAAIVGGLVVFAWRRPELNRIMMHEGTAPSDRLTWLVSNHLEWRHRDLRRRWISLTDQAMAAPLPVDVLYHMVIGAASLLYANAPEARLLGIEPDSSGAVAGHADSLVAMLLPSYRPHH
ncbi:MAG: TetR/AcrR family transcriptional regulator [Actinomycetia bacterium]|nr:TetR/AcrR family transcriptional regulator [Actinomycetes bacterium]